MRYLYVFTIALTILASGANAAYPRFGVGGNVSFAIPIGDMTADDLDTGYHSTAALRGKAFINVFDPLVFEAGGLYGFTHKANEGITEGQADWTCNYAYAGTGALVDMGLFKPHLTAGLSYFWITRHIAEQDKNDRDILLPVLEEITAYGYYIELGLEYYLYEHLALDGGIRFDQALTDGKRASILHLGVGVDWYIF